MKNPLMHAIACWQGWWRLRSFFDWKDALMQIDRVLLPDRFAYRAAARNLSQITRITAEGKRARVFIPQQGLVFYWDGRVDGNLYFLIEQEFETANPHCYTTAPICLSPKSLVIDIGACEGLFAFRLLKNKQCARVLCFEPFEKMAKSIEDAAQDNGVSNRLCVERLAVSNVSGPVRLISNGAPDACRIEPCEEDRQANARAIRLDSYFEEKGIALCESDLIKVDAEGADLSVIEGAKETIARCHPQIAITTYHEDHHAQAIGQLIRSLHPDYKLRLKGFSHWTSRPRPVLLQASCVWT